MNWLAHILISKNTIDYQLGNILADPLRGRTWEEASPLMIEGFKMHKSIDAFTDSNSLVSQSKLKLERKGHLKGVVIDIAYDYFLINHWDKYSYINLNDFINHFYQNATTSIQKNHYPDNAKAVIERLIFTKNMTSYGSIQGLEAAFQRIDSRLSNRVLHKESTTGYLPTLEKNLDEIEKDFLEFFPLLIKYFTTSKNIAPHQHCLKT